MQKKSVSIQIPSPGHPRIIHQDNQRATDRHDGQLAQGARQLQSRDSGDVHQGGRVQGHPLLSLLLPRSRSRAQEVWSSGLEQSLPIQCRSVVSRHRFLIEVCQILGFEIDLRLYFLAKNITSQKNGHKISLTFLSSICR